MENSRKSSVKTEESPSGRLLWLETQILQDSPGKHCKDVAPSFQNTIFPQILVQDMQFSCLSESRRLSSSWLCGRRMRRVPRAKRQSSSTPPRAVLHCLASRQGVPCPHHCEPEPTGPNMVCVALETSVLLPKFKSRE